MRKVLITSFDMEIGGVERSLIALLEHFDYKNNQVDLMLYSHTGEFMKLLPTDRCTLLKEVQAYTSFRKSIGQLIKERHYLLANTRILACITARGLMKLRGMKDFCYCQMQWMWKYAIPFLPSLKGKYDVVISYLWPHDLAARKVKAKTRIAWIHTDYSQLETDISLDLKMWKKFDHIIAVSESCKKAFLSKYPGLEEKVTVIENLNSPDFIRKMAKEKVTDFEKQKDEFRLLTVARLSPAKGIDQAVETMKILKQKGLYHIKWYIAGYGGEEETIKKLIRDYGLENQFILLGKKTNPYPYIKQADLYVQPSRYEGKAVTVTEAQILGKPVLITNFPTAASQIRNGVDGMISEMSPGALAEKIELLYKNDILRTSLAKRCRETDYDNSHELEKLYALMMEKQPKCKPEKGRED